MRAAKFNVPSFRKATPINPCLSLSLSSFSFFSSFFPARGMRDVGGCADQGNRPSSLNKTRIFICFEGRNDARVGLQLPLWNLL